MSITNGYCTLAALRERLGNFSVSDTAGDGMLEQVIEAVSRWIDNYTNRRFYVAAETRYYTAEDSEILYIDDVATGTGINSIMTDDDGDGTFETKWETDDYNLNPYNAALMNVPYTSIETAYSGDYSFPINLCKGVRVYAWFGYDDAIPDAINEACLLMSERLYKRKDAIFGVMGGSEIGGLVRIEDRIDPDVKALIEPYRRMI